MEHLVFNKTGAVRRLVVRNGIPVHGPVPCLPIRQEAFSIWISTSCSEGPLTALKQWRRDHFHGPARLVESTIQLPTLVQLFFTKMSLMVVRSRYCYFIFNFFNWSVVDLQCSVSFSYIKKWPSHVYIYTHIYTHSLFLMLKSFICHRTTLGLSRQRFLKLNFSWNSSGMETLNICHYSNT